MKPLTLQHHRRLVTVVLRTPIVGGIPADPNLIEAWTIGQNKEMKAEARAKIVEATKAEVEAMAVERTGTVFKRNADGAAVIEGRQLKAAVKEVSNILRDALIKGEDKAAKGRSRFTNLKSRVAERAFIEEEFIVLRKADGTAAETSFTEKPICVMTPQGERTSIKRFESAPAGTVLSFTVRWFEDGVMDDALLVTVLEHMQWNGIGADRSQGNGQFEVQSVTKLEASSTLLPWAKALLDP